GNMVTNSTSVSNNNWTGGVDFDQSITVSERATIQKSSPFTAEQISVHTAEQAFNSVLLYSGASYKRDAVDIRICKEVKDGTATYTGSVSKLPGIIDTQKDVEGWPVLNSLPAPKDTDGDGMPDDWEIANKLDPNKANANGRDLSTAYDNIEV